MIEFHPVQNEYRNARGVRLPAAVTRRAYEVYSALYGTSQTLERLNDRGGFSLGEVIAFLYAYPFPRDQWSRRVSEAFSKPIPLTDEQRSDRSAP